MPRWQDVTTEATAPVSRTRGRQYEDEQIQAPDTPLGALGQPDLSRLRVTDYWRDSNEAAA
jgi:hypothetical protein